MLQIPNWLFLWVWRALLGEVYPAIRAIAIAFSEDSVLRVRMYLDRPPEDYDFESLATILTSILANASSNIEISKILDECVFSDKPISQLEPLGGFIYARREY